MTRYVLYFLAGALLCWLPLAGICVLKWHAPDGVEWWKADGLLCAAVTGPICLVPTTLSLVLNIWSKNRSASEQMMAVMGGMAIRMGAVLAVGLAVFLTVKSGGEYTFKRPEREYAYWGSLLVFYLFTLGWETFLAARHKRDGSPSPTANGAGS